MTPKIRIALAVALGITFAGVGGVYWSIQAARAAKQARQLMIEAAKASMEPDPKQQAILDELRQVRAQIREIEAKRGPSDEALQARLRGLQHDASAAKAAHKDARDAVQRAGKWVTHQQVAELREAFARYSAATNAVAQLRRTLDLPRIDQDKVDALRAREAELVAQQFRPTDLVETRTAGSKP